MIPRTLDRLLLRGALALLVLGACPIADAAKEFAGGRLIVADILGDSILELSGDLSVVNSIENEPFHGPRGLAFSPDGQLHATSGDQVLAFNGNGKRVRTITGLQAPRGLAFGPEGHLYATSTDRIVEIDGAGEIVREIGGEVGLGVPVGLAFGPDGNLFCADAGVGVIRVFDSEGHLVDTFGPSTSLLAPSGLAFGPTGRLFVASQFSQAVLALDATGEQVGLLAPPEGAFFPAGLTFGPNGHLFVADVIGGRLLEFDVDSLQLMEEWELPPETSPEGVAFAPYRFMVRLTGQLGIATGKTKDFDEKGTLSLAPGASRLMLRLDDDGLLEKTFDSAAMVFQGFEAAADPASKSRMMFGTELPSPGLVKGNGTLKLDVQGKLQDLGASSGFKPKKGSGTLHRAGSKGIFKARVKVKKALN